MQATRSSSECASCVSGAYSKRSNCTITRFQALAIWEEQVAKTLHAIARSSPPGSRYIKERYQSILKRIGAKQGKLIAKIVKAQLQNAQFAHV